MFLCITEEHSWKWTEMEAAALMMIGHVLQSWKQMIICDTRAERENAPSWLQWRTFPRYHRARWENGGADFRTALLFLQSERTLSQFRVAASFLWCQKLYSRFEKTKSTVWTWLGHGVQCRLAQKPLNLLRLKWDIEKSPDIPEVSEPSVCIVKANKW